MVRSNRVKFEYITGSPSLYGDATTGKVDIYIPQALNGLIQSVYFQAGNYEAAGSLTISVSGTGGGATSTEGIILNMTSGTSTGHHLGEDWVVFPRAKTVTTDGVPTSGGGNIPEVEIPIYSILRVQAGVV